MHSIFSRLPTDGRARCDEENRRIAMIFFFVSGRQLIRWLRR
jgi:hypothetical protein